MAKNTAEAPQETPDQATGIAAFALKNAHFVVVGCLMVAILGTVALLQLPKDLLPTANLPAVQILSFYAGMPVEDVAQNLTARFERYTGQAIGMERQESKSLVGVSITKNFFGSGADLNSAISQTTALVMSMLRKLPPGAQPPMILPFDPMAAVPLALVAVSGDLPEKNLYDTARYQVRSGIQSVSGAMAPTVMGGSARQILVWLKPEKLAALNFSSLDVIEQLTRLNTFVPSGDVKFGDIDYQIISNGMVGKVEDMGDFPLRSQNGVAVYVKDVGVPKDAAQVQTNVVRIDGKPQVYVPVYRQPGANSIQVIDDVKTSMVRTQERLKGITLKVIADQTVFIRHAIASITEETLIGGGLAALMVLLFLGSPRATFGIMLSLPISLLCAFLGLKASGQSINAMTLGGLALSIGVLVDNSIVVIENIMHKLDGGLSPRQAALAGSREVALPVLSATVCTLIVFFPIVFLSGVVQVLFSALAKSVTFAMIGSYFAALAVIPLFTSKVLRREDPSKKKWLVFRVIQAALAKLTMVYGAILRRVLRGRWLVLPAVLVALGGAAMLYQRVGYELFPRADAGNFVLDLRFPSGTRIEKTTEYARQVEDKLRQWIDKDDLSTIITNAGVYYGFPAAFTPNTGTQDVFFNVELTEDRRHTSQYYAKIIRQNMPKDFPQAELGIELGGLLTSALNGGLRSPIDIQVEGADMEQSHKIAATLMAQVKELRGATDVRIQQRLDAPQLHIDIDRKKAGALGITTDETIKNIVSAVSGSSAFNPAIWVDPASGIDYQMGVQVPEANFQSVKQINAISITGKYQSRSVPLGRIATLRHSVGPTEINHTNLRPVIDLFLDAQDRDVGSLSAEIASLIRKTELPKGYYVSIRGEIAEMQKSVGALGGGFVLAALLVYLVLVVQFRSFMVPFIIMACVPLGLVGIIVMLAATNTYFSIQAAIGAIFMIGIAVANGVLLVEFIIHKVNAGESVEDAIVGGAMARLRPILMTSLASMLGLIPMAIGLGHGAEANIPLGRSVIGGQLLSTVLTLFVVPALFRMLRNKSAPVSTIVYGSAVEGVASDAADFTGSHPQGDLG